ncbi:GNAT family N-acetyltransferase [Isoptericola sp. 178]|uniref:GNAT family N-acetyltransferase n=1 Tax=Isoptericola sp. 178 TaxID=3064651 RepID=UPI002714386F|nr:GNAT family N-acetyltransferase [Isoptericola sp. 178]MDO8142945.1 GNAT family N-acetyltransferase [Isoptericola sp. 178]
MSAPPVVVRPGREEEAAEVAWLGALTFPLACPPGTSAVTMAHHIAHRLTPETFRSWIRADDCSLLVADAGGLVGYALLLRGEPEGVAEREALRTTVGAGPYVELSKIYVHPDRLGDGTAGTLMTGAVEGAGVLAPHRPLWLGTNGDNARAQAFYRKHGFAVIGARTYDVGGVQHDDVVMLHTPVE